MKIDTCCDKRMEKVGLDKDPILGTWVVLECPKCHKPGMMKLAEYQMAKQIEDMDIEDIIICGMIA